MPLAARARSRLHVEMPASVNCQAILGPTLAPGGRELSTHLFA